MTDKLLILDALEIGLGLARDNHSKVLAEFRKRNVSSFTKNTIDIDNLCQAAKNFKSIFLAIDLLKNKDVSVVQGAPTIAPLTDEQHWDIMHNVKSWDFSDADNRAFDEYGFVRGVEQAHNFMGSK